MAHHLPYLPLNPQQFPSTNIIYKHVLLSIQLIAKLVNLLYFLKNVLWQINDNSQHIVFEYVGVPLPLNSQECLV